MIPHDLYPCCRSIHVCEPHLGLASRLDIADLIQRLWKIATFERIPKRIPCCPFCCLEILDECGMCLLMLTPPLYLFNAFCRSPSFVVLLPLICQPLESWCPKLFPLFGSCLSWAHSCIQCLINDIIEPAIEIIYRRLCGWCSWLDWW